MTGRSVPWRRPWRAPLVALLAIVIAVAMVAVLRPGRATGALPEPSPSVTSPAVPSPAVPSSAVTSASGAVTIAAVGDLVCDLDETDEDGNGRGPRQCRHRGVSDLVLSRYPAALLALGDTQYPDGTLDAYREAYAPTYGRLLDVTYPVPGNHEYRTSRAAGYFAYFGARAGSPDRGYYSIDLGGWHLVALNSNCDEVSCAAGRAQERWLRADLAAHPAACTIAYWHHPRWSHGEHGDDDAVAPLVQALYEHTVDVLLVGHDHHYERFTPRAPDGSADPRGVREFVVGTGGRSLRGADGGNGTEAINSDSFGALFLTLTPTGYSWEFAASDGTGFTDRGSASCR